jgi:LPXTG-motif cell wall-anchored protein
VRGESSPGTSACGDPAICNDSGILGVDATASTPSTTDTLASTGTTSGDVLPQTGAPEGTQGLVLVGFGLLAGGVLMVRPRRLARHKA